MSRTVVPRPVVARDAGVIVEWNEITERTLVENAQPIFQSILFYGFRALAMYDAVVTIEGKDAAAALIARHPEECINATVPQPHDDPLEPGNGAQPRRRSCRWRRRGSGSSIHSCSTRRRRSPSPARRR